MALRLDFPHNSRPKNVHPTAIPMSQFSRPSHRNPDQLREIKITRQYTKHAEGSVLVEFGDTKVLCTASVEASVPRFLKGSGRGWVTAEYGMLPRSTGSRMDREAARGKQSGRTQEIQRLIGRALRAAVDLTALSEHTIKIDCDVIQADGGTRCASICGGWVALKLATNTLLKSGQIKFDPIVRHVAAVSCGIVNGEPKLDLNYEEDSSAGTDANFVMDDKSELIEIQCSAEKQPFSKKEFEIMYSLASKGIQKIIEIQKSAVNE